MIQTSSLTFSYSSTSPIHFPNVNVRKGEHILVLGESGCGKTTLLHLLGGLLRGYTGSLSVDATELSSLSETTLDKFRGQKMGFVFQKNHLISALSVEKNLMMAPYLSGLPINTERIEQVLESLGLAEKRKSKITELSHGQAQRVAIARAVLNKPSIIFADEPTSALDDKNCNKVITLLLEAANQNHASLVVATHDQRIKNIISNQLIL